MTPGTPGERRTRRAHIRILYATDGSPSAQVALDMLCDMPHRIDKDAVTVLSVVPHRAVALDGDTGISPMAEETAAAEIADRAARRLTALGVRADVHVGSGSPARSIVATAVATRSDLIVLGSRGRGPITAALLGSTARSLVHSSPLPVLVVRDRRHAPRRVLVAVDGSPDSRAVVTALGTLALPRDTEVTLVHVVPDVRVGPTRAHELLHITACQLPPSWATAFEVERGDAAERILSRAAAIGADLIVLGSRGTGIGAVVSMGTTADRVLSGAHCAVLVGRAAEQVKRPEAVAPRLAEHAV